MQNKKTAAVVLAAGRGKRMNSATAKQYLLLEDKPVLYYALAAFEKSVIDDVVLVTAKEEIEYCQKEIVDKYGFRKVKLIVVGGAQRYHSVANGLEALYAQANTDGYAYGKVLIHDGARPFVSEEMICQLLEAIDQYKACVTATPVKDTIKIVDNEQYAIDTPNRSTLWAVQTPQAFSFDLIYEAYKKLIEKEQSLLDEGVAITDDAMVVEHMTNQRVKLIEGSYNNIKLTTPEDLYLAGSILRQI